MSEISNKRMKQIFSCLMNDVIANVWEDNKDMYMDYLHTTLDMTDEEIAVLDSEGFLPFPEEDNDLEK